MKKLTTVTAASYLEMRAKYPKAFCLRYYRGMIVGLCEVYIM